MDWSKLDAELHKLFDGRELADDMLRVFVRSNPGRTPIADADLQRVGRHLYTTTVRADGVSELSEQPWVKEIALSWRAEPAELETDDEVADVGPAPSSARMRRPARRTRQR